MSYEDIAFIERRLKRYLKEEVLQGPADRFSIFVGQVGPLASHYNHDPKVNPKARHYQTKAGEKGDFGHALLQLMIYGISRDLPIHESICLAFESLETKDWMAKISDFPEIQKGVMATGGKCTGPAYVDPHCLSLGKMPPGSVLVASHPDCGMLTPHLDRIAGIVTDEGGMTCHAAIVSRERGIPCVVGTVNATQQIEHGITVMINEGRILVKPARKR